MRKEPSIEFKVCNEDVDASPFQSEFKIQTKPCPIPTKKRTEEIRKLNFEMRHKLVAPVKLCPGGKKCKCWVKKGSDRYQRLINRKGTWKILPVRSTKKYYGIREENL